MRYWDVYTKWGEALRSLDKCSLDSFGIKVSNPLYKNIYICYRIHPMPKDFSICNYMQKKMTGTTYYIPDIEWNLIKEFGFSIEAIKQRILDECAIQPFSFRLQKASFLTVEPEELKLFPILGSTYMSHILKLL